MKRLKTLCSVYYRTVRRCRPFRFAFVWRYDEQMAEGELRTVYIYPVLAPVKAAILPLSRKETPGAP
jgi:hypothetical protein